jgi:hypothetical protein
MYLFGYLHEYLIFVNVKRLQLYNYITDCQILTILVNSNFT